MKSCGCRRSPRSPRVTGCADAFRPFRPWNDFIAEQRAGCTSRHRANELPEHLLATLEEQLGDVCLTTDEPVFLHTELTDTNLMVAEKVGHWQLSGVFDFEPSMLGNPLYDLPAITMFVARGDPQMCRAALAAFGAHQLDDALRGQLLACVLLHRYSHLGFFLRQVGVHGYPQDWNQVANALLGF
jgi:hygromycin-B 7''-O-kinase